MIMNIEQYVQSSVLLTFLTVISILNTKNPYLCILSAGLLMILFTIKNLLDKQNYLLIAAELIISIFFAVISGSTFTYLILYECKFYKYRTMHIFTPAIAYFILKFFRHGLPLSVLILNIIILTSLSIVIYFVESLIKKYISTKNQITQAVSVTAVSEMYEKKLNQELIIKNYLIDKNARLEEREDISRNIHNSVGHSITAAIMTLDAADMLYDSDPDKARVKMNVANDRIRTSLDNIRHAVRVLDNNNELIAISDFISDIKTVTDNFMMDTNIKVRTNFIVSEPEQTIPHEHTEFLTGAVKELLSNGVRHGNADLFTIMLTADSRHINISVSDNGKSDLVDSNKAIKIEEGFGLKRIVSYVKRCGGTVIFSTENGFKTEITIGYYSQPNVT